MSKSNDVVEMIKVCLFERFIKGKTKTGKLKTKTPEAYFVHVNKKSVFPWFIS